MNNYLTFLSTNPTPPSGMNQNDYILARSAAAIMLKNNVKSFYKTIPESNKEYLRATILLGLQDSNPQIRNYSGNVVTEMVKQGGIMGWPQVLSELIALVDNTNGNISAIAQDGAMGAILKICEDNKKALNKSYSGTRPLDFLIPRLLDFTRSPNSKVRAQALGTLNFFISEPLPEAVTTNTKSILSTLINTANDTDEEVRRYVCRSFTSLTTELPEIIAPHLDEIIDYVIAQQKSDPGSDLALDAAEFFFENSEIEELRDGFGNNLHKIIPVLLESMIYSEDEQARLEGEAEEDADREDREQDIKPQFATAKDTLGSTAAGSKASDGTNGASKPTMNGYAYANEDDLSEGEIEEDEDDYGEDPEEQWNLRKCSAAALDSFSERYHAQLFEVTLPYLNSNLNHSDWPNREAAVLALGAISAGCMEAVQPHLPELTQFLLGLLQDPQPFVRQITCWALGRYCPWAASLDQPGKQKFFEPIMDGLLQRMLDQSKRVQQAAASAFANLEEEAKGQLAPYGIVIARQFVKCFAKYKDKNMFILYDCVQTLAENLGPEMARPEMVELLMPALISRWSTVEDRSREMFPLLECLAYVASAMGRAFAPFAKPIFSRCINLIHRNLEEGNAAANTPYMETPDKDFLVTSLDLMSAIIQALDENNSATLVTSAEPNFFEILAYCMQDSNNDVRQSAYALLGDCAMYVFPQLQPYLQSVIVVLIRQLDLGAVTDDFDTAFRVINNACWSIGEIAMRHQAEMGPYVEQLLQRLGTILVSREIPDSLNENAAIALGRLGIGNDQQLAPHLASFAPAFLATLKEVQWTDEKRHALEGFVNIVGDNPQAMEHCLLEFFAEMATAQHNAIGQLEGFQKVCQKHLTGLLFHANLFSRFFCNTRA